MPIPISKEALNTLRYIHANPKAAQMQQSFFYNFSNYGIYDRLSDQLMRSHFLLGDYFVR
ncbi:hypothetical protein [Nostoc sp.]|uniref:hypothetical protein n=1 Tax=Nostoc sp. TaxID=1180 RepID=UPI002FF84A1E